MNPTAAIQARIDALFPGLLGIILTEVTADRVTASLMVRRELCTSGNTLHGGAIMTFADTLGAVATVVNMPAGHRTVTIESKTNFTGGAAAGTRVTGTCTPVHKGRTTQVWQTEIRAENGKLAALVTQTQLVLAAT